MTVTSDLDERSPPGCGEAFGCLGTLVIALLATSFAVRLFREVDEAPPRDPRPYCVVCGEQRAVRKTFRKYVVTVTRKEGVTGKRESWTQEHSLPAWLCDQCEDPVTFSNPRVQDAAYCHKRTDPDPAGEAFIFGIVVAGVALLLWLGVCAVIVSVIRGLLSGLRTRSGSKGS